MTFIIRQTIIYAVPLMIVALAGVFAERSGIINLALDGMMIFGAFAGVLFINLMQKSGAFTKENAAGLIILTLLFTALSGVLFSFLLSLAAVRLKANQTITGTAINMLSPALVIFLAGITVNQSAVFMYEGNAPEWFMISKGTLGLDTANNYGFLAEALFFKSYPADYICIFIFIILSVILYKTRLGLRLRASGENPYAADSLGIDVKKMRYIGTAFSGALAALGGFVYALTTANCTATGDVGGLGFLALALMIFGNWKPLPIAAASLLFGLLKCVAAAYSSIDLNGDGRFMLAEIGISTNFYRMLPYIMTLIVLAFTSKNSRAPKAEGIPFDK